MVHATLTQAEYLTRAVNASPVVAIIWQGAEGCPVQYVSENVSQWGYSAQNWCRERIHFLKLIHPEDLTLLNAEVAAYQQRGIENYVQQYRLRAADGSWRWIEDRTWMEYGEAGEILWAYGVLLDVSNQRQNQENLLKLQLAVEQSPASIVITNLAAEIEYANAAFFQTTGYAPAEVLGRNPRMLQSGKTAPTTYARMWAELHAGRTWVGELINRRKDGSEYIELARISPVTDAQGQVTHYLGIKEDITQRKRDEERIYQLAFFDALTALPNRRLLLDRFAQAASLAERHGQSMALLYIDVDHFKHINDSLGHSVGDALLLQVAQRLSAQLRHGDTLSRQGGDEFVLLLPECDASAAQGVAEKLLLASQQSVHLGSMELVSTVSIGVALYPRDGRDFETLARHADVAMYQAKLAGRSTWRCYDATLEAHSSRALRLFNDLRHASARGQLHLVYQPQVELASARLSGVEALLRWQHPEFGAISPAEFIPMAESSGLVLALDAWVLEQAMQQLLRWQALGLAPLSVAVNVSAAHFSNDQLAQRVAGLLQQHALEPARLELELTEGAAMHNPLGAERELEQLAQLQVGVAIDDFGTGYSSLARLKRFHVSKLKIDQSFVHDLMQDADDRAIVRAIIGLAEHLGLHTVAEGVETAEQLAWLQAHGCHEAQGYWLGRPMAPEALPAWLEQHQQRSARAWPY